MKILKITTITSVITTASASGDENANTRPQQSVSVSVWLSDESPRNAGSIR